MHNFLVKKWWNQGPKITFLPLLHSLLIIKIAHNVSKNYKSFEFFKTSASFFSFVVSLYYLLKIERENCSKRKPFSLKKRK